MLFGGDETDSSEQKSMARMLYALFVELVLFKNTKNNIKPHNLYVLRIIPFLLHRHHVCFQAGVIYIYIYTT